MSTTNSSKTLLNLQLVGCLILIMITFPVLSSCGYFIYNLAVWSKENAVRAIEGQVYPNAAYTGSYNAYGSSDWGAWFQYYWISDKFQDVIDWYRNRGAEVSEIHTGNDGFTGAISNVSINITSAYEYDPRIIERVAELLNIEQSAVRSGTMLTLTHEYYIGP